VTLSYRPEIDGLRTIAVSAVLLYHAELWFNDYQLFSGGFLGVDVFFVISGFLITSILLRELREHGRISFLRFYERRARRLLPALLLVIFVSLPAAWKLLLPSQFIDYGQSILSSLAFGSNFYWHFSLQEYGAESALVKPFLHTWSLAIEEQYYVVFPLLLLTLYRLSPGKLVHWFVIIIAVSLGFAEWFSGTNPSASFYLLPSRLWELLSGGVLALIASRSQERSASRIRYSVLPSLGLILIVGPMIMVDHAYHHPGVITALPVIGTALIILFSKQGNWVYAHLSSRVFVGLGLISYSLYLWHYPIFAFGRILEPNPSLQSKALWISLSVLLSVVTYFLVEKPFRRRSLVPNVAMALSLGSGTIVAASLMMTIIVQGGFQERLDTPQLEKYQIRKYLDRTEFRSFQHPDGVAGTSFDSGNETVSCYKRTPSEACRIGDALFVTLGDSFVAQYDRALYDTLKPTGHGLMTLGYGQCPFVSSEMYFSKQNHRCGEINQHRWNLIKQLEEPKIFVIAANETLFPHVKFYEGTTSPIVENRRERSNLVWSSYLSNIRKLVEMGHKVVLVGTVPNPSGDARALFLANVLRSGGTVTTLYSESDNSEILKKDLELYASVVGPDVLFIAPARSLCQIQNDEASECLMVSDKGPIYNESRHLSYFGAKKIMADVLAQIQAKGWLS